MPDQRALWQSQNYIRRPDLVESLLDMTDIGPSDLVVEIGPGRGIITKALLKRASHVIAIEQDAMLVQQLQLLPWTRQEKLQLIAGDFLSWPLPKQPYQVFSNIPFNMTADIVNRLTRAANPPTHAYLIMQEAAAHRFVGQPLEKETLKSILLKIEFQIEIVASIPASEFQPRPSVNIVLTHFRKRSEYIVSREHLQEFRDFVVYGYTQWQPNVLEALKKVLTKAQTRQLEDEFQALKPRDLTLEQWLTLFNLADSRKRQLVRESEKRLEEQQRGLQKQHRTRPEKRGGPY